MDHDPPKGPSQATSAVAGALWTVKEVAAFLNLKESTIRFWVHIGYIPHIKFRGAVRFRESDIIAWLNQCVAASQTSPSEYASRILRQRR
jgi:excisionase family DNA binding protein